MTGNPPVSLCGIWSGDNWRAPLEQAIGRQLSPLACFFASTTPAGVWIVALDDYHGPGNAITMHSAGTPGALTRRLIRTVARYVFDELQVHRINGLVRADNQRAIDLNDRLGFVREGVMREYYRDSAGVHDVVMMRMLRAECRWLQEDRDGRR